MQGLFRKEAVSWSSVCNGLSGEINESQRYCSVGMEKVPIKPVQRVGGASGNEA